MKTATPPISEDQLWASYMKTHSDQDRNAIAERYLPWVERVAGKIAKKLPAEVMLGDLKSSGYQGLLDAITKFNPARGLKFTTFAAFRVKGKIYDDLRNNAPRSRMVLDRNKKLHAAESTLHAESGRKPSPEEMAEYLAISHENYAAMNRDRSVFDHSLSFVVESNNERNVTLGETLPDTSGRDPADDAELRDQVDSIIQWVLKTFRVTDALILRFYYLDQKTHREIGETLGRTESLVSQAHSKLIRILRAQFTRAA